MGVGGWGQYISRKLGATIFSPPLPPPPLPLLPFLLPSQTCVYEGTFCFDGESPVVVTDNPMYDPMRINDFTHR